MQGVYHLQASKERQVTMKTREQALQQAAEALQGLNTETVQMMTGLMLSLAQKELYSADTPEARLEEIHEAYRQEDAKLKEAREQKAAVFLHDRNSTMKMLGRNSYYTLVSGSGRYRAEYDEILDAYLPEDDITGLFLDIYSFGIICGKREERSRRKVIS